MVVLEGIGTKVLKFKIHEIQENYNMMHDALHAQKENKYKISIFHTATVRSNSVVAKLKRSYNFDLANSIPKFNSNIEKSYLVVSLINVGSQQVYSTKL